MFTDVADGEVYNVQAKKDLYLDSSVALVNATTDPITQDFFLLPDRTSEEWRHYVKFVVWGPSGYYEGVTVTVYENSDVTALYTAETGNDGATTFIMDRQQKYRVTFIDIVQGIDREMVLYPKDDKYLIFVASTGSWSTYDEPVDDVIGIDVSTEIINSTHIVLGSGWDWHSFPANQKLNILKELGIGRRSIAKIVTEHRNTYEHQYVLPSKNTIEGHLDSTDLWLNESYTKYFFTRIGLFDLPVYEVITEGDEIKKIVLSNEYKSFIYFWDHKKEFIQTAKDKTKTVKDLKAMRWEEILSLEKGCIKRLRNKEIYSLSQPNLTKIFNIYNKKAAKRYYGFFKPGIHVAF